MSFRLRPFVALITGLAIAFVAAGPSNAQDAPAKEDDLLQQQRERIRIAEQKLTKIVDDALVKAKLPGGDLNATAESLRNALNLVRDDADIGAQVRQTLARRVQRALEGLPGPTPRFKFKIAEKTPIDKLLPTPPRYPQFAGPLLSDDLAKVPELAFQEAHARNVKPKDALKQTAHMIAKVNHVNQKRSDAYMEALLAQRSDLAGLPFVMGDACRTTGTRSLEFMSAVQVIRAQMGLAFGGRGPEAAAQLEVPPANAAVSTEPIGMQPFPGDPEDAAWNQYIGALAEEDKALANRDAEEVQRGRVAALMQILGPASPRMRQRLAKYLGTLAHVEATRALARLAIFSAEEDVRKTALAGLKVRRDKDYTDILLAGLRYPWPAVAKRSADALAVLQRSDLVPRLVDMLDEPDPRLPVLKTVAGKSIPEVRELVRVNHHRNCLLCHAPGTTPGDQPLDAFTAAMPIPGEPMQPSGYQSDAAPDILVRIDVTYLRQDFSMLLPVADAHPWPEMQRFDFLVRTRTLSEGEASSYADKLTPREPGVMTPYHRAVLHALRELTSRDTAPTAAAWRQLLKLPVK